MNLICPSECKISQHNFKKYFPAIKNSSPYSSSQNEISSSSVLVITYVKLIKPFHYC